MKKILSMLLAAMMVLSLVACGSTNTPASDGGDASADVKPVTLKLTHCQADGHPIDVAADKFAELVAERTEGRVNVTVYPANMLGAESVTRDMIKEGTVDIVLLGSAANNYNTAMNLVSAFYLLQSTEECDYMLFDSPWAQKWLVEDYLADEGVAYLDSWTQSPRQTMTTKPFTNPNELKSIKLRVPAGIPVWETAWNAMGAMTVSMGLDDAFSGLQQGVCDGVEGPIDQLSFYSFQEVAKNLILTQHCFYSYQFLMNNSVLTSLSEADQQIIRDTAVECGDLADQLRDENAVKLVEDMKAAGVTVTELTAEQLQVFADLALTSVEENMDVWGQECYDEFMADLTAFRG